MDEGVLTLPALNFAPAKEAVKTEPRALLALPLEFENPYFTAKAGKDGYLTSLICKQTGKELVSDARVPFGTLVMQMDYGDSWWDFSWPGNSESKPGYVCNREDGLKRDGAMPFLPRIEEAYVESADDDAIVILQKGTIRHWITVLSFETRVTLSRSARTVSYTTRFTNTCKDIRVRAVFGTNALTSAKRQIPYAMVPFGDGVQACQRFARLDDGTSALALINNGTPAYAVDGDMLLMNLMRSVAMEYKCDSADSYGIGRNHEYRYAVLPCAAEDEKTVWREALSFNTPLLSGSVQIPARGIKVDNAFLSAIRVADGGVFLRVYNPSDHRVTAQIKLEGLSGSWLTDGLGNPEGEISLRGDTLLIPLDPYKVQGIFVKP